jgi:hypothetical protein
MFIPLNAVAWQQANNATYLIFGYANCGACDEKSRLYSPRVVIMNSLNLSVSKNISLNKAVHATSGSHLQFCLLPEIVASSLLQESGNICVSC